LPLQSFQASRLVRGDPNNRVTWRELHRISGRGIIADTGYGVGGGKHSTADWQVDAAWFNLENLRSRLADGVIAITQAHPAPGWELAIPRLRKELPPVQHCFGTERAALAASFRTHAASSRTRFLPNRSSEIASRRTSLREGAPLVIMQLSGRNRNARAAPQSGSKQSHGSDRKLSHSICNRSGHIRCAGAWGLAPSSSHAVRPRETHVASLLPRVRPSASKAEPAMHSYFGGFNDIPAV